MRGNENKFFSFTCHNEKSKRINFFHNEYLFSQLIHLFVFFVFFSFLFSFENRISEEKRNKGARDEKKKESSFSSFIHIPFV